MSGNSLARLLSNGAGGVYRLSGTVRASRLAALAQRQRLKLFTVDLSGSPSKRGAMSALSRDLDFPDYFGNNWDALADCLNDFGWAPAQGYLLRLSGAHALARSAPRDFAMLLEILQEAAQRWGEQGVPFYVLLDDAESAGGGLPVVDAA